VIAPFYWRVVKVAYVIGIITSIISAVISGFLAIIMKNINDDTRVYRQQRKEMEELQKKEAELKQQKEDLALLAIMRTMLKDNADRCFDKGYYSVEEREIYSALFKAYKEYGGNGVIDEMGNRLRPLPYELSDDKK
jgi:biopolymer transport protein ExbB/TolQ